jgi:hypothetical protein
MGNKNKIPNPKHQILNVITAPNVIPAQAGIQAKKKNGFRVKHGMTALKFLILSGI